MNLDIDIGNTRLKWRCGGRQGVVDTVEIDGDRLWQSWSGLEKPERVRFVSVVCSQAEQALIELCQQRWGVSAEKASSQPSQAGVTNSYECYQTMGADRWLAMLAAYQQVGGGCCVVDCGSAVTVDYIDAGGVHLGGFIAPGLRLMRKGLLSNTRQIDLPEESRQRFDTRPGRSTEEAVGHGIELMLAALAQRVVADCQRWLGEQAQVLVTGGDGQRFIDAAGCGRWCPDLVIDGLRYALPDC